MARRANHGHARGAVEGGRAGHTCKLADKGVKCIGDKEDARGVINRYPKRPIESRDKPIQCPRRPCARNRTHSAVWRNSPYSIVVSVCNVQRSF